MKNLEQLTKQLKALLPNEANLTVFHVRELIVGMANLADVLMAFGGKNMEKNNLTVEQLVEQLEALPNEAHVTLTAAQIRELIKPALTVAQIRTIKWFATEVGGMDHLCDLLMAFIEEVE